MIDFKRSRRKAEQGNILAGGLPLSDPRRDNKKTYGESYSSGTHWRERSFNDPTHLGLMRNDMWETIRPRGTRENCLFNRLRDRFCRKRVYRRRRPKATPDPAVSWGWYEYSAAPCTGCSPGSTVSIHSLSAKAIAKAVE